MDPYMSIFLMIAISFPEAILVSYFAIMFMGGKTRFFEILLIGVVQAGVAYVIRSLPIPGGYLHTIFLVISYIALIAFVARLPIWSAVVGVIAGIIVLLFFEIILN